MRHCGLGQKVAGSFFPMLEKLNFDGEIDRFVLEEKISLRCWDCLFLQNWIGTLILSLLLKLPPRNLKPLFVQ